MTSNEVRPLLKMERHANQRHSELHREVSYQSSDHYQSCDGPADTDDPLRDNLPLSDIERRRSKEKKVLLSAMMFCLVFMMVEFGAGVLAHSLALLTDAVHLLTDVGSYALSFAALMVAGRSACGRYNYGWHRAEVLGTLLSVFTVYVLVGWIVLEAFTRMYSIYRCTQVPGEQAALAAQGLRHFESTQQCEAISSPVMIVVGVMGLLVNVVCGCVLYFGGSHGHSHFGSGGHGHGHGHGHGSAEEHGHGHGSAVEHGHGHGSAVEHGHGHGHGHGDAEEEREEAEHSHSSGGGSGMAVNAAILHAMGDCVQSVGVIFAGIVIYTANRWTYGVHSYRYSLWNLADPICSILFAVVTIRMSTSLLRDLFGILMETTPPQLDYSELEQSLLEIPGVVSIHDLHVWSLSSDYIALSAHLVADDSERVLRSAQQICSRRYHIDHTTFQVDTVESGNTLCPGNCSTASAEH